MERVRFIESVKVRNDEGREFEAGKEYDLPAASARRWIVRGKAELVFLVKVEAADDAASAPQEYVSPVHPQDDATTATQGDKRRNAKRTA